MKGLINLDYEKTCTKKNKEKPRGLINLDLIEKETNRLLKYLKKKHKKNYKKIKRIEGLIE